MADPTVPQLSLSAFKKKRKKGDKAGQKLAAKNIIWQITKMGINRFYLITPEKVRKKDLIDQ